MQKDSVPAAPPEWYELVEHDINEKVQAGDLIWDEDDEDWLVPLSRYIGHYVSRYAAVARPATVAPVRTVKRIPARKRN